MSRTEIDRLGVIRKACEGRLSQEKAGELIGLSGRQVRRLITAYELGGPAGLASRKRGMPSNRRLPDEIQVRATNLVRERYADFGPTLAREKLLELNGVRVAKVVQLSFARDFLSLRNRGRPRAMRSSREAIDDGDDTRPLPRLALRSALFQMT